MMFVVELIVDQFQFFVNYFYQMVGVVENVQQFCDLFQQFFIFVEQFFMFKVGQFLQMQIQNCLSLLFGQIVFIVVYVEFWFQLFWMCGVIFGVFQYCCDVIEILCLGNQCCFCFCWGWCVMDQFDNWVDVGQCNGQCFEDMCLVVCFVQFENCMMGYYFMVVVYKCGDDVFQVYDFWLIMVQSYYVDVEGDLQLGLGIEVVKYYFFYCIVFYFNYDVYFVFIRFVMQCVDVFYVFFFDQFGDFFDQVCFVYLIWNFVYDDGFVVGFCVYFYFCVCVDVYFIVIGVIGFFDVVMVIDNGGGWEIRVRNMCYQFFNVDVFIVNICQIVVNYFCQVMWWYVGGYFYGDFGGVVYQQVRNFGWYDVWNMFCIVIVVDEIDCFFFKIGYQFMSDFCQMNFGIMYCCGGVVVDGIKVILVVYQYVMQ